MKTAGISIALMLLVGAFMTPVGVSEAQMAEQAQEKMPEHAREALASLDNFGLEVADFVHEVVMQFKEQRQETIDVIKQCREDMNNADPSDRAQVRQECRTSLDEIKDSYREIRSIFYETFKEYRDSFQVLRDEAKGKPVFASDRQAAIDDIRETAKLRHQQMMEMGPGGAFMLDVEELRERMMNATQNRP